MCPHCFITVTCNTPTLQAAACCVQGHSPSLGAGVALVRHGVVHEGPVAARQGLGGVQGAVVGDGALQTSWA